MTGRTKEVSKGALIKRINRKLAHEGERLCVSRAADPETGRYYVIDPRYPHTIEWRGNTDHALESLGRLVGVLRDGERVAGVAS